MNALFYKSARPWWLLLLGLLAVAGAMAWNLQREHLRIQLDELARLDNQSQVIQDNLMRQFDAINKSLQSIEAELPAWSRLADGRIEAVKHLQSMEATMPAVRTFLVLNKVGEVTLSNREELMGRNFAHRAYFATPQQAQRPQALYVSPPFKSVLNHYLINLTRSQSDAQGVFSGAVSAALDPVDVEILLNSVRYAEDMRTQLVHGDGLGFVSRPALDPAQIHDASTAGSFFSQHHLSGRSVSQFAGRDASGKEEQLVVVRTLSAHGLAMDKPLMLVLSRQQDKLFAGWRDDVQSQILRFVVLALSCVAGLMVFQRLALSRRMAAQRLKLATEASGVGIWEFDLVSKRYYWDKTMFKLFGLQPESVSARNDDWQKLLSAEDLKRMRDATRLTIRQGQPFDMIFQITRPDGQVRSMRNHAALYADDQGVPRRLIGASEDVTERKQQESELRVAAVAFESTDSMLVADARAKILRVNHAFTLLFGYAADEVVGKTPSLLKSDRQDAEFFQDMRSQLHRFKRWQGEVWNRCKNGHEVACSLSITAVADDDGCVTHYVATHTDISVRKAAEDEVKRLAFYDPLTQLPNRRLLSDRLQRAVSQAHRNQGQLAVMYVDLDKFKPVNDRYGHAVGDALLRLVAQRLTGCVRESDTVARVGGDEFVVLLLGVTHVTDATRVAEKIHAELRRPFVMQVGEVSISSSTGIALYPQHGKTEAELSHSADVAMYAAKGAGRDRFLLFEPG